MDRLKKYATFIKIEHTLFSLPLLFAGCLLAEEGWPSFRLMVLILFAASSARLVAMALNRIVDRDFDRLNPRTQNRHLASGIMNLIEGWLMVVVGLGIYVFCCWVISDFCLKISWIPIAGFVAYPYFKRFTKWAHLALGLVWAMVPLAGYLAIRPSFENIIPAVVLALFSIFWLTGFDIIYATMDEDFDRDAGLHSLPSAWGSEKALRASSYFHIMAFFTLLGLYLTWFSGPLAVMLLVIVGILLIMQAKLSQYVDFAFFHLNVVLGFAVLAFVYTGLKGV